MRLLELLGLSAQPEEPVEQIKLDGPFIPEDVLVRKRDNHLKLLYNTLSKCNLMVSRDLLVFSKDCEFASRDDCRIQIGLTHHIHQIELSFRNNREYEIVAIDRFILLNPSDAKILKEYLSHHLPTEEELKKSSTYYLIGKTMFVNVIYKETMSPITRNTSKIEVVEVEENEASAAKYAKLYSLQLPADDKTKVVFRTVQVRAI